MTEAPENLKYAQTHEWAKLEDGGLVRVGITDFAVRTGRHCLHWPARGRPRRQSQEQLAVVESVKTASDLFSPVSGSVVAVNEAVQDAPELVNEDAYQTWLFCIQADDPAELDQLLDAQGYQNLIEA